MKILWVNQYFLHPTERGGQIRSLGILRELHKRHEVHYAALDDPDNTMGVEMAPTFCTKAYRIPHTVIPRGSAPFLLEVLRNVLGSSLPLAVSRYASRELANKVKELDSSIAFDCIVCDFVASGVHIPDVGRAVLFQHNVETTIFERHAEHGRTPLHRWFFGMQARRMHAYEEKICRTSAHVIAVSAIDMQRMQKMFGVTEISDVPTGVDVEYFRPPKDCDRKVEFVFLGSMDWLPNIEGVVWFVKQILPLIRQRKPDCRVTVVGRRPDPRVQALASSDPLIEVTGTVPDVRPFLWNSRVSILPLQVGGGTRLKVYEAMAAGLPVVSTSVGMEGLACRPGRDIVVADTPCDFAERCLCLLDNPSAAERISTSGLGLIERECSWGAVARQFERILSDVARRIHTANPVVAMKGGAA